MPEPITFREFVSSETPPTVEQLSVAQRRKQSVRMRRLAPRIKMARKRALRKTASAEKIRSRARRSARMQMFRKITRGKSPTELSPQRRASVEKRLKQMRSRIDTIAKRAVPKTRKIDRERRSKR